jgi:hypothetical protein
MVADVAKRMEPQCVSSSARGLRICRFIGHTAQKSDGAGPVQTLGGFPVPTFSATYVAENGGASCPAREARINRRFPSARCLSRLTARQHQFRRKPDATVTAFDVILVGCGVGPSPRHPKPPLRSCASRSWVCQCAHGSQHASSTAVREASVWVSGPARGLVPESRRSCAGDDAGGRLLPGF